MSLVKTKRSSDEHGRGHRGSATIVNEEVKVIGTLNVIVKYGKEELE